MKINGHVERGSTQAADEGDVVANPGEPSATRRDDDVVEVWIPGDDRRGRLFDDVSDVRRGKMLAQAANGRCRENDVANLAKANQQKTLNHQTHQITNSPMAIPIGHSYGSMVASSMSMTGMSSLIG